MIFTFISIALVHFFGVMSPGPGTFCVINSSIRDKKENSLKTIQGVILGESLHIIISIIGIGIMVEKPHLFRLVQIFGAIFLAYLGVKCILSYIKSIREKNEISKEKKVKNHFINGFLKNFLNMKGVVFYLSLVAEAIPGTCGVCTQIFYGGWSIFSCAIYMYLMRWFFSSSKMQKALLPKMPYIELVFGILLLMFAVKLYVN